MSTIYINSSMTLFGFMMAMFACVLGLLHMCWNFLLWTYCLINNWDLFHLILIIEFYFIVNNMIGLQHEQLWINFHTKLRGKILARSTDWYAFIWLSSVLNLKFESLRCYNFSLLKWSAILKSTICDLVFWQFRISIPFINVSGDNFPI